MKRVILSLTILVCFADAENLRSILDYALSHNELSIAKDLNTKKPLLEQQSIKRDYFPKIDIGSSYQGIYPKSYGRAGDTYNAEAKISLNIYDGNKKIYQIKAKNFEFKSLKFQSNSFKKELQFNIVNLYFNTKALLANLTALRTAKKYLEAEYKRVKNLFEVGTVTKDEVKKIEASLFSTIYKIDKTLYEIAKSKKELALYIGKSINNLGNSTIIPPVLDLNVKSDTLDQIKALKAQQKAIEYNAASIKSAYQPHINIEDSYHIYGYDRTDYLYAHANRYENNILFTFNMRLFDNNSIEKQREAMLVQKLSLQKEIRYYEKEQQNNIELALLNIKTIKSQITSAKKSLEAANKAFELISKKYENGAATVVDYLDALSVKTDAMAQYKAALYNLQVAYSAYYLYTNNEIKEFVK